MKNLKTVILFLFATPRNALTTLLIVLPCALYLSYAIHQYLDHHCASMTVAFLMLMLWFIGCLLFGVITVLSLSHFLIYPGYVEAIFKDEMAEAVQQLYENKAYEALSDTDLIKLKVNPSLRFFSQLFLFTLIFLLSSNAIDQGFLGRFQASGWALVGLRSEIALKRIQSIDHLLEQPKREEPSASLKKAIIQATGDEDEGVRARAIFACGQFDIEECILTLKDIAIKSKLFRKEALLALGRITIKALKSSSLDQTLLELAQQPEIQKTAIQALISAFGMQKTFDAQEFLKESYEQAQNAFNQKGMNSNEFTESLKTALLALWALGELRDPKLLPFFEQAIAHPNLQIRCAAAYAFEKMVVFESSELLQKAFTLSKKEDRCDELLSDIQIGGKPEILLPARAYQLNIARALATTDDPALLKWMVDHQEEMELMTRKLMHKYYQALEKKDKQGLLENFKQRNLRKKQRLPSPSPPSQLPTENQATIPPSQLPTENQAPIPPDSPLLSP